MVEMLEIHLGHPLVVEMVKNTPKFPEFSPHFPGGNIENCENGVYTQGKPTEVMCTISTIYFLNDFHPPTHWRKYCKW